MPFQLVNARNVYRTCIIIKTMLVAAKPNKFSFKINNRDLRFLLNFDTLMDVIQRTVIQNNGLPVNIHMSNVGPFTPFFFKFGGEFQ